MEMVINMLERREVSGNIIGAPVKVKLTGGRYFFIALGIMMTMFAAYCIVDELNEANELKRCEIDIQRQRLELEQRQYTLDSLQYFSRQNVR